MITRNEDHYNYFLNKLPDLDHMAVGWSTKERQEHSVKTVCSIVKDIREYTVLDYGCGLGHMIDISRLTKDKYTGYDIHAPMIEKASIIYPGYKFINDITEEENQFDYVLMSGVFNLKDAYTYNFNMWKSLRLARNICRKGLAFNLLSDEQEKENRIDQLAYRNKTDTFARFCSIVAHDGDESKMDINKNGMIYNSDFKEFTIYLYKQYK